MDTLLNEGLNSNSVLENAKSAQKYYNDVYSTLDVSLLHPARDLSVGVQVQIGDKDYDEEQSKAGGVSGISSSISIANVAQARVAPDLSDLRQGQEFNNHLQAAGNGLAEIRKNLDQLATQIKPDEDYAENEIVQDAVARIREIVESSTYAGKPVFVSIEDDSALAAIDIATVPDLTEKRYADIQGTIIANAESVALDSNNVAVTKSSETFILSQSNSNKVFSFPESTPLDDINATIADFTEDPSIHPLIYFDTSAAGLPEVVTGEGQGLVEFAGSIRITELDGELFSQPLQSYFQESAAGYSQRDGRVVEADNSLMSLETDLGEDRVAGTINLAEDNVVSGVDIDNMRTSNHTLSRSETFNKRLAEDRIAGDGFAVTPLNPGESSGVLTAGGITDSDSTQSDYDARVAEEILETSTETEDEATADNSDTAQSLVFAADDSDSDNTGLQSVFTASNASEKESAGIMERIVPRRGGDDIEQYSVKTAEETAAGVVSALKVTSESDNTDYLTAASESKNSAAYEIQVTAEKVNPAESASAGIQRGATAGVNEPTSQQKNSAQTASPLVSAQKQQVVENSTASSTADSTADASETAAAETAATDAQDSELESSAESEIDYGKARFIGTNPVKELENIQGTVAETLLFTLRGNRGELDYVVSAGVSVDVLSLAINTTTSFTGVTANTANGRISLAGASSLLESMRLSTLNAISAYAANTNSNNEGQDSAADFNDSAEPDILELLISGEDDTATTGDNSDAAVNSSMFSSRVNMEDLGFTRSESGTFTLLDFASDITPDKLASEPQLARQVVANSYRYIDTVQNNLDSINSLNVRNTYDALERVSTNILDNSTADVVTATDAEAVLNNVAVGINNIVSINGGRGLSGNTVVSFNLLSNIDSGSFGNNRVAAAVSGINDSSAFGSLNNYQYSGVITETTGARAENSDYAALSAYGFSADAVQQNTPQTTSNEEEDALVRFDDMLVQAQEAITEIERINEEGLQRREDSRDNIRRAEERYFSAIENAKDTIREYGRDNERANYERDTIREEASERINTVQQRINSVSETDYTALSETLQRLGGLNTRNGENNSSSYVVNNNIAPVSVTDISKSTVSWDADSTSLGTTTDNSLVEAVPVMDSLTTREPVAVTASAAGGASPVMSADKKVPENVIKLFEDKIGTVMVHDQGYTIKALEGSMVEMLESEPAITVTILDTALQDIADIRQEVADLQAQELENTGDYLLAALETYGSDQNAANPLLISAMARA